MSEEELQKWLEAVSKQPFDSKKDFVGNLSDGIILCKVLAKARGKFVMFNRRPNGDSALEQENIQNFEESFKSSGENIHWKYSDISRGKKKNELIKTVIDLSNIALKQPKFKGPYLQMKDVENKKLRDNSTVKESKPKTKKDIEEHAKRISSRKPILIDSDDDDDEELILTSARRSKPKLIDSDEEKTVTKRTKKLSLNSSDDEVFIPKSARKSQLNLETDLEESLVPKKKKKGLSDSDEEEIVLKKKTSSKAMLTSKKSVRNLLDSSDDEKPLTSARRREKEKKKPKKIVDSSDDDKEILKKKSRQSLSSKKLLDSSDEEKPKKSTTKKPSLDSDDNKKSSRKLIDSEEEEELKPKKSARKKPSLDTDSDEDKLSKKKSTKGTKSKLDLDLDLDDLSPKKSARGTLSKVIESGKKKGLSKSKISLDSDSEKPLKSSRKSKSLGANEIKKNKKKQLINTSEEEEEDEIKPSKNKKDLNDVEVQEKIKNGTQNLLKSINEETKNLTKKHSMITSRGLIDTSDEELDEAPQPKFKKKSFLGSSDDEEEDPETPIVMQPHELDDEIIDYKRKTAPNLDIYQDSNFRNALSEQEQELKILRQQELQKIRKEISDLKERERGNLEAELKKKKFKEELKMRNEIQDYKNELLREVEHEKKLKREEIAEKLKKFEDKRLQTYQNELENQLHQQREKDKLKLEEQIDSLSDVIKERDEFKSIMQEMKIQNKLLKEEMENEITTLQDEREADIEELERKFKLEKEILRTEIKNVDKTNDDVESLELKLLALKTQLRTNERIFDEEKNQLQKTIKEQQEKLDTVKDSTQEYESTIQSLKEQIKLLESAEKEPSKKEIILEPEEDSDEEDEVIEAIEEELDSEEERENDKIMDKRKQITIDRLTLENEKLKKTSEANIEIQKDLVKKLNLIKVEKEKLEKEYNDMKNEYDILKDNSEDKISSQMLLEQMRELLSDEMKTKKELEEEMRETKDKLNEEIQLQLEKEMELEYKREQIELERKEKEKEMNENLQEEKKRLEVDKKMMEQEIALLEKERKNFEIELKKHEEKKKEEKKSKFSLSIGTSKNSSLSTNTPSDLSSNPISRRNSSAMYVTKLNNTITKLETTLKLEREQHEKELSDLELELKQVKSSRGQLLKLIDTQLPASPSTPKKNLLKTQLSAYFTLKSPRNTSSSDLSKQISPTLDKKLEKKVFGIDLNDYMEREVNQNQTIPYFIKCIMDFLEEKALNVEGIFRKVGTAETIQQYKSSLDSGDEFKIEENCYLYHELACLLKLYLRELPSPLLCFKNYDPIISLFETTKEKTIEELTEICKNLPKNNRNLLYELLFFLNKVSKKSDLNKMNSSNIAIVFGMNIIKPRKDDPLKMIEDCKKINYATEILMENFEEIFKKE
eukprot:gene10436-2958_t